MAKISVWAGVAIIALLVTAAVVGAVRSADVSAQAYDSLDAGAGYHVTYHGWSEDGWVHWQQECYAEGCGDWYIVSVGW